ncbi:MAG TPA: hypothetical protein VEX88_04255 [Glaciibacter sp.]|nr:hypothetical protein [Glaciibacter sp.]
MRLTVTPRFATTAVTILVCAVVAMVFVSFVTQAREYLAPGGIFLDALSTFDRGAPGIPWLSVDEEQSIPAWFSSSALLLCAVLLVSVSSNPPARTSPLAWKILAVIFLFLSIDEAVGFHEKTVRPLRNALGTDGILYSAWVIPAGILVVILALAYARFALALPGRSRNLVILAAVLFVGGALVTELFGAAQVAASGQANLTYVIVSTTEELMEMLGVVTFLYALMLLSAPEPHDQGGVEVIPSAATGL